MRCVHFVDNETLCSDSDDPTFDKIGKARWLVESFTKLSHAAYNVERHVTVDEMIVAYKRRFYSIRQFMRAKPIRFIIKIWACMGSSSRYIRNVIIDLGKGGAGASGLDEDHGEGGPRDDDDELESVEPGDKD